MGLHQGAQLWNVWAWVWFLVKHTNFLSLLLQCKFAILLSVLYACFSCIVAFNFVDCCNVGSSFTCCCSHRCHLCLLSCMTKVQNLGRLCCQQWVSWMNLLERSPWLVNLWQDIMATLDLWKVPLKKEEEDGCFNWKSALVIKKLQHDDCHDAEETSPAYDGQLSTHSH